MAFKKYQHVERFGNKEVEGIEFGKCYVFPKIDGTNGSVYLDEMGLIKAGSRKRELTIEADNAGFCKWVTDNISFKNFFSSNPSLRLYGEWLVPHTLKTYDKDAWRDFYVFDVCRLDNNGDLEYLPYDEYKSKLELHGINFIPPIATVENGDYEKFATFLDKNVFLIEDGNGVGEGIVIKNYDFKNKFGRTAWAKIIRNEFKEKHYKLMGSPSIKYSSMVEEKIVEKYLTDHMIDKVHIKIFSQENGWESRFIPSLLETVYNDFICEELYTAINKFKNPTINFKTLKHFVFKAVRESKPDLF